MRSDRSFERFYAVPSRNGVAPPKASRGSGVPMVNMGDLFAYPWIRGHEMERVPLTESELQRSQLMPGDLVFARRSLKWSGAGVCSIFLGSNEPTTFESSLIRVRLDPSVADPLFFFYFFRSPQGRRAMETIIEQTAVAGIKASELARLRLSVPSRDEQERIAAVLGSLDAKIDGNRRLAELLEEIAATMFRAQFVDFVGVEEFEQSEIGRIPRGWRAGTLGEVAQVHRDLVKGGNDSPYVGLDAMPRGSTVLAQWATEGAPTGQASRFDVGDILFGKLRPYFHKVGVAPISGRCSTEILVLRAAAPEHYGVVLCHAASKAFIDYCVSVSRGTRMPRAEWKDAASFKIAIPPPDVAAQFTSAVRTMYAQIRMLTLESRSLSSNRDALMPKLMSGQVRVAHTTDPAEMIESAADALVAGS
jgi:type I restriction enzyme S subunit